MLKFFRTAFGSLGDRAAIPDAADVNGNVSYSSGYTFDYQRQKTDPAAKNIERDKQNQLFFDITNALGELQGQGVPDFITSALNGGTAYSYGQNALVRYSGELYVSLVAANTATPADATKWAKFTTPANLQTALNTRAMAGGTADALTGSFTPAIGSLPAAPGTLSLMVRAGAANATTTPTFQADATAAKAIVKGSNAPLVAGDIAGAGHWLHLDYDPTLDKWVLQNPAFGVVVTTPYLRTGPNFANGSAMVGQRADAGITTNLSTSRQIGGCDNIGVWASGGAVSAGTVARIASAISGSTGYASRAAGVTLTGSGKISHSIRMESRDALKYKNKTCSFSVKVDHDAGVNVGYTLVIKKANSADNFGATTTIATSGVSAIPTATGSTVTFNGVAMGDCSNGIEFEVQAACGAVTTKNFNCTEFCIDIAATAQSYVAPDYADELRRCQRYLPMWVAAAAAGWMPGMNYLTNSVTVSVKLPVPTCKVVTGFTASASNIFTSYSGGSSFIGSGASFANALNDAATLAVAVPTVTQGQGAQVNFNAAGWAMFTGGEL